MEQAANQSQETVSASGNGGSSSRPAPDSGWSRPLPEDLPRPTYWPFVLAVGLMFALGGIVTFYPISLVGLAVTAIALGGWVGELRHDRD